MNLKELPRASEQEVFDVAVRHLLKQNKKSSDSTGTVCAYRGVGGLKCAAGVFIADAEYEPWMEGRSWAQLAQQGCVPIVHHELIQELQRLHDCAAVEEWHDRLRSMSVERGLEFRP